MMIINNNHEALINSTSNSGSFAIQIFWGFSFSLLLAAKQLCCNDEIIFIALRDGSIILFRGLFVPTGNWKLHKIDDDRH
jgi:hypothetical protein